MTVWNAGNSRRTYVQHVKSNSVALKTLRLYVQATNSFYWVDLTSVAITTENGVRGQHLAAGSLITYEQMDTVKNTYFALQLNDDTWVGGEEEIEVGKRYRYDPPTFKLLSDGGGIFRAVLPNNTVSNIPTKGYREGEVVLVEGRGLYQYSKRAGQASNTLDMSGWVVARVGLTNEFGWVSNQSDPLYNGGATANYGTRPANVPASDSIVAFYYRFGGNNFDIELNTAPTIRAAGGFFILESPSGTTWKMRPEWWDSPDVGGHDRRYVTAAVMSPTEHLPKVGNTAVASGWKLHFAPDNGNSKIFTSVGDGWELVWSHPSGISRIGGLLRDVVRANETLPAAANYQQDEVVYRDGDGWYQKTRLASSDKVDSFNLDGWNAISSGGRIGFNIHAPTFGTRPTNMPTIITALFLMPSDNTFTVAVTSGTDFPVGSYFTISKGAERWIAKEASRGGATIYRGSTLNTGVGWTTGGTVPNGLVLRLHRGGLPFTTSTSDNWVTRMKFTKPDSIGGLLLLRVRLDGTIYLRLELLYLLLVQKTVITERMRKQETLPLIRRRGTVFLLH